MSKLELTAIGLAVVLGIVGGLQLMNGTPSGKPAPEVQSTPEQVAKAEACRKVLGKSQLLRLWESDGTHVSVEVGRMFYASDFSSKVALNSLLLCVGTEGRMNDSIRSVEYLDYRSHEIVARWSLYAGLKVTTPKP